VADALTRDPNLLIQSSSQAPGPVGKGLSGSGRVRQISTCLMSPGAVEDFGEGRRLNHLPEAIRDFERVPGWVLLLSQKVRLHVLCRPEFLQIGSFHVRKLKPDLVWIQSLCRPEMKVKAGHGLISCGA
jgi:hypothetical protein